MTTPAVDTNLFQDSLLPQTPSRKPIKRNTSDLSYRRFSLNFFHSKDIPDTTTVDLSLPVECSPHSLEPERRFSLNPSAFSQEQRQEPQQLLSQNFYNDSLSPTNRSEILLPTVKLANNATTKNTLNDNLPTTTRRSSFKKTRASSVPLKKNSSRKDKWYEDFKTLDSEFHRFASKTGVNKANVLRLALLPFLRQQRGEFVRYSSDDDASKRVRVFQKWWIGILSTLRDRERPVSGMDRSAYLEAVSAIVARTEWLFVTGPMHEVFQTLLLDTVKYVVAKLSIKAVPANFAAFAGKILAYAFFYAPDVAPVLLYLLPTAQTNIDRITNLCFQQVASSHQYTDLASAASLIRASFPDHLGPLVAQTEPLDGTRPSPPVSVPELYGPWARRWNCFNSDIFYSFFKHYYTIISRILPLELPWNAHLASPGLIIIHSFLLGTLDSVVRPAKPNSSISNDSPDTHSPEQTTVSFGSRRVDQLKMLAAIREILHNDDNCRPFFEPFCIHFEKILHAVVLKTNLYEVETCIILCDLIEEFFSSLVLTDTNSKKHIIIQKENSIDWNFWIIVVQRLLSSQNINTILRALAFLFNIWNHIPVGSVDDSCRTSHDRPRNSSESKDNAMFKIFDRPEGGIRWNFTVWLLSPQLWKTYFCHWNPMVRAYYQRLVCWRVASVGNESGFLSSVLYANYNSDTRNLLEMRLGYTSSRFTEMNLMAQKQGLALSSSKPCSPALNRRLRIAFNPACMQPKPMPMNFTAEGILTPAGPPMVKKSSIASTRRIDPYEVFDDIAYSFPTVPVSSGMISSGNIDNNFSKKNKSTSAIESLGNMIKKKWSLIRGDKRSSSRYSLKNKQETASVREYAPSLTSSSSTMSSSFIRTPGSGSSYSDARSPGSILSLTSYMNCDDDMPIQSLSLASGSPTSLTMSLIPPPPQILRKRPEIARPFYRFSLEFSEQDFEKQHQSVSDRTRAKARTGTLPPVSKDEDMVTITELRLPFGEPFIDEYDNYCDDSDSDFDKKEDSQAVRLEFEYMDLRARERTRRKGADDRKYWQYAGRALNEWASVVIEFEEYIDKYRKEAGVFRVEELATPFMVAEIQVKSAYV